jgi:hypothetical protein
MRAIAVSTIAVARASRAATGNASRVGVAGVVTTMDNRNAMMLNIVGSLAMAWDGEQAYSGKSYDCVHRRDNARAVNGSYCAATGGAAAMRMGRLLRPASPVAQSCGAPVRLRASHTYARAYS